MSESFWTIRHTSYGVGCVLVILAGTAIGSYFGDVMQGLMWGSVAAIVYGVIRIVKLVRSD